MTTEAKVGVFVIASLLILSSATYFVHATQTVRGQVPYNTHLRNAGGLVTEDALRSLVLSQRLLQTREIILVHHTNCGLHDMDEPALRAKIQAETGRAPAYAFGSFHDLDQAVREAITRVREHPLLPHRDQVRGFVYEVETGHLREVHV